MEILYHIGEKRFIVKENDNIYIISFSKQSVMQITSDDAESILRQGYWQVANDIDDKIKEACASLIHST